MQIEEDVARLKEENRNTDAKRRMPGQEELEDTERSAGPRMAYQEVIRRLWKINPDIIVKDGSPGNVAFYVWMRNDEGQLEETYIGGCPTEPLPEYSHITLDDRGLPKREVRGWRSVLMSMIKLRVISYRSVVKQFGEANGQRSYRWHEQLSRYRN